MIVADSAEPTLEEVEELRRRTPLVAGGRAHLNNAGAAAQPTAVLERMERHLRLEAELGGYEAADAVAAEVEATYERTAGLVGAAARNIAMVENATAAYAQALSAFDFAPGDVIVTTQNDYASNQIMFLSLVRRRGVHVVRAEDLPEGGVDPSSVEELLERLQPKLVAVTHVPTSSGLVQPAAKVGDLCRRRGIAYLVDACQSVGQMPVDVGDLQCDFLCATGRKFLRGPRGTGFLFVSDRMLEAGRSPLHLDLRGAEWVEENAFRAADEARRFENWEFNYAALLGLGEAVALATEIGLERIAARARRLAATARRSLEALDFATVLDRGAELAAIVSVALAGVDGAGLVPELRRRGIHTSLVARSSAVVDFDRRGVDWALRVSPHVFNTEEEIDRLVGALEEIHGEGGHR